MKNKILKQYNIFILIISFLSIIFTNNEFRYVKSITSLINPLDITSLNDDILVSTSGGLYKYNKQHDTVSKIVDNLKYKNISSLNVDSNDRIWLGGEYPNGVIQILDSTFNLDFILDYANFDQINQIVFSENHAFASIIYNGNSSLAKYSNDDNPSYLNIYNHFENSIINDIDVHDDSIYIATNSGLLKAYSEDNSLVLSSSWMTMFEDSNVKDILVNNDIYFLVDSIIYRNNDSIFCCIENNTDIMTSKFISQDIIYYLSDKKLYENTNMIFEIPDSIQSVFTDFEIINDNYFFSIANRGLLITDLNFNLINEIIPNTLFSNSFTGLNIYENNLLSGISSEGGFIIYNPLSIDDNIFIKNFYPINDKREYVYNKEYPNKQNIDLNNSFYGKYLFYVVGGKSPLSIDFNNENELYFINSGMYPSINHNHYSIIVDSLLDNNFSIDNINFGSLYKINLENFNISEVWGDEIFNGLVGDGFTTINQLIINDENIYILNPYAENGIIFKNNDSINVNIPISIKSKTNDWSYVYEENFNTLVPTEITFGPLNNIWIGYESIDDYSPGGVRVVQTSTNNFYNILDELNGVNVWSLNFGKDQYNNDILWVISDLGVMGYQTTINSTLVNTLEIELIKINPYYYYSDVPFNLYSKIRIDKQNNAWINTSNQGLKIIKSNGELWPNNLGITTDNSDLLSNNVLDIVFDDYGYVYISTDLGISVIETVFSDNIVTENNVSISPNPFIIGNDDEITISNFLSGSDIKIMTLSGRVVKNFNLDSQNKIFSWDGKGDDGNILLTGIYLIVAFHPNKKNSVTKFAIVN